MALTDRALYFLSFLRLDKTQVFHDQIEVKQKDLQPWMAKIDKKQADIDVATSERDALKKKAEAAREARENAEAELQQLRDDHETKKAELEELEAEKTRNQHEIRSAEKELQVRSLVAFLARGYSTRDSLPKPTFSSFARRPPLRARRWMKPSRLRSRAAVTTGSSIPLFVSKLLDGSRVST